MRLGDEQSQWLEVAGVARDGKYITLDEPPVEYFFLPFWQNYDGRMTLVAHTAGDPESVIAGIRQEVKALDEQLPVYGVRDVTVFLDTALSAAKATAATVSGFGLVAVLMTAIGLYGVMSYAVAERTGEIGVRDHISRRQAAPKRVMQKNTFYLGAAQDQRSKLSFIYNPL